ncbi:MAG: TIGR02757 family protein [Chitinophagales bacterium]|nr:TIGR02757 family protein [Chitinophagales bacterium]MDW8419421.1 TIGR02757 family protein [Chitinophagales bacterium]
MHSEKLYELLERKYRAYNRPEFIEHDPISIPHLFTKKQDIEIIGFWTAMLAWGNRKTIIESGKRLAALMDNAPHDFVLNHRASELKRFLSFKHRTFNATDALYFIAFFKHHYTNYNSLEDAFIRQGSVYSPAEAIAGFHEYFFSLECAPDRTRKHIATPLRRSTCKRINMFLRWMVRKDKQGVDFGLWSKIKPAQLLMPLDVHVERTARRLGLLKRRQTDWQAVLELTENLRKFDPADPVKYDYALFGISVLEKNPI